MVFCLVLLFVMAVTLSVVGGVLYYRLRGLKEDFLSEVRAWRVRANNQRSELFDIDGRVNTAFQRIRDADIESAKTFQKVAAVESSTRALEAEVESLKIMASEDSAQASEAFQTALAVDSELDTVRETISDLAKMLDENFDRIRSAVVSLAKGTDKDRETLKGAIQVLATAADAGFAAHGQQVNGVDERLTVVEEEKGVLEADLRLIDERVDRIVDSLGLDDELCLPTPKEAVLECDCE